MSCRVRARCACVTLAVQSRRGLAHDVEPDARGRRPRSAWRAVVTPPSRRSRRCLPGRAGAPPRPRARPWADRGRRTRRRRRCPGRRRGRRTATLSPRRSTASAHAAGRRLAGATRSFFRRLDAVRDGVANELDERVAERRQHVRVEPHVAARGCERDRLARGLRRVARSALERGEDGARGHEPQAVGRVADLRARRSPARRPARRSAGPRPPIAAAPAPREGPWRCRRPRRSSPRRGAALS